MQKPNETISLNQLINSELKSKKDLQSKWPNKKLAINHNNNKVAISITKASNKIYKPKLYNKAINNLIHSRC